MTTTMTKTAFAELMDVNKSQPTRWAAQGMPVLPDGSVEPEAAARWVRANIDPSKRVHEAHRRGRSQRPTTLSQPSGVAHLDDLIDGAVVTALPMLAERVPAVAAVLATALGVGEDVARALCAAMKVAMVQEVAGVLDRLGAPAPHGTDWIDANLCRWADWRDAVGSRGAA